MRTLSATRPDLESLYQAVVTALWSPASENDLLSNALYTRFPATLWDAFAAKPEAHQQATGVIASILWAMVKPWTWKVNEWGGQDVPVAWTLWQNGVAAESQASKWQNVFAAAIRHIWFDDPSIRKAEGRELALAKLREWSSRKWG